jgi:hypothetical protein
MVGAGLFADEAGPHGVVEFGVGEFGRGHESFHSIGSNRGGRGGAQRRIAVNDLTQRHRGTEKVEDSSHR